MKSLFGIIITLLFSALLLLIGSGFLHAQEAYPGTTLFITTSASAGALIPLSDAGSGGLLSFGLAERGLILDRLLIGVKADYGFKTGTDGSAAASASAGLLAGWSFALPGSFSLTPAAGFSALFPISPDSRSTPVFNAGFRLDFHVYDRSKLLIDAGFSAPLQSLPGGEAPLSFSVSIGTSRTVAHMIPVAEVKPAITLSSAVFSPDGDGEYDTLRVNILADSPSSIRSWQLDIIDDAGSSIHSRRGSKRPPDFILWDGSFDNGGFVSSADEYMIVFTAVDKLDRMSRIEKSVTIGVLVIRDGDKIKINIPNIIFPPRSADFSELEDAEYIVKNKKIIARLAEIFSTFGGYEIHIEGHANSEYWYDEELFKAEQVDELIPLSLARAEAIRTALIESGISPERITVEGLGASEPAAAFDDALNSQKNRRVEFILVK